MGGWPGRVGGQSPLTIWVVLVSFSFILKSQLLHLQNENASYLSGFRSSQQSLSDMMYGRVVLKLGPNQNPLQDLLSSEWIPYPQSFRFSRSGVGQESSHHCHIAVIIIICILFLTGFQAMWKLLVQGPFFENH